MTPTMLIICIAINTCAPAMKQFESVEACEKFAQENNIPKADYTCKPTSTMTQDELMQLMITGSIKK